VSKTFRLTLSCPDRPGIVARISALLLEHGANILEAQQFDDVETGRFFMRIVFESPGDIEAMEDALAEAGRGFDMDLEIHDAAQRKRVLMLVSKLDHCLGDLLYRYRIGELEMDVVGVVSNHPKEALNLTTIGDIPYHHLPITSETKPQQEAQIRQIIETTGAELVVLARYMQVLSDEFSAYLAGRCVNIHHSFLPGFKGAKPYHQAHARGVKMIGATAHFVTADLDEGPIIVQDVEQVSHSDTPDDMVRKGRDIERRVLARAVRYLLEDRVMINDRKSVVFAA
jgi:formyltetrahydrofolate deformylase